MWWWRWGECDLSDVDGSSVTVSVAGSEGAVGGVFRAHDGEGVGRGPGVDLVVGDTEGVDNAGEEPREFVGEDGVFPQA